MDESQARILVADDEPSIRFVLREALEDEGHEVTAVADGTAALEALAKGDYRVAFLDIRVFGVNRRVAFVGEYLSTREELSDDDCGDCRAEGGENRRE